MTSWFAIISFFQGYPSWIDNRRPARLRASHLGGEAEGGVQGEGLHEEEGAGGHGGVEGGQALRQRCLFHPQGEEQHGDELFKVSFFSIGTNRSFWTLSELWRGGNRSCGTPRTDWLRQGRSNSNRRQRYLLILTIIHAKKVWCCGEGYFGQKKFAQKVRKLRQNVNRDKSA